MHSPVHPGEIVKHDCLKALGLSVTEGAEALGVTRPTLSRLINGKASVSPEMALRLSKAFGSRPEVWLKMQMAYDMVELQKKSKSIKVKRLHASPSIKKTYVSGPQ